MKRLLALMLCTVSLGAWCQCAEGEIPIDYTVGTDVVYPSKFLCCLNVAKASTSSREVRANQVNGVYAPGDYTFIGSDDLRRHTDLAASPTFTNNGVGSTILILGSVAELC